MKWIAHRGNRNGPNPERENTVEYLQEALDAGFDVECDVWWACGKFWLGHDGPKQPVATNFLCQKGVWCHAKSIDTLDALMAEDATPYPHAFWHQNDDVTITTEQYIWTYPGKPLTGRSICVMPELSDQNYTQCAGICSDFIADIREKWDR